MRLLRLAAGTVCAVALAGMGLGIANVAAASATFTTTWSPVAPTTAQAVTVTTTVTGCGTGNTVAPSLYYMVSNSTHTYNYYYSNVTLIDGGNGAQASVNLGDLPAGTYQVYGYGRGTPCFSSSFNYTNTAVTNMTVSNGPSAPTNVVATANLDGTVSLSWNASTDPTATVTSYTVSPSPACAACSGLTVTGTPAASSTTVGGLTAGTSYVFTVHGADSNGTGPDSAPSAAVTADVSFIHLNASTSGAMVAGHTQIQISGQGLEPNSQVTVTLHSTVPVTVLSTSAAANGSLSATVTVPAGTVAGAHTLMVVGTAPSGAAVQGTLAITVANSVPVPGTGADVLDPWPMAPGVLLLLLGVGLLVTGVRRRRSGSGSV